MPQLACEVCSSDIEQFYDTSLDIVDSTQKLLLMGNNRAFETGRVVILRDGVSSYNSLRRDKPLIFESPAPQHFKLNIGILLKQSGEHDGEKWYYVLAMVSQEMKGRKRGKLLHGFRVLVLSYISWGEQDTQSVPPRWDLGPESLLIDNPVYELASIPPSSIALATRNSFKVECYLRLMCNS